MSNSIVFLENYVESAASLPPELTRILATVKDLDERSCDLAERIKVNLDICLSCPPQYTIKHGSPQLTQVIDLRKGIEEDQRLLVQWAEEKMSLACIMSDLLDMHVIQLDKDLQGLESELEGISVDMDDEYDPVACAEQAQQDRQRELEIEAELRVASSALQEKKRREREDEERQSHIASRRGMSDMSGLDADVPASPHSRKLRAPGSSPPPAYVPSPSGHPMQNGRRQFLDNLPTRRDDFNNSKRNARERAMDATAHDLALEDGLSDEGFGMDNGDPPPPYMPTLPEGMETSAGKPQGPGRLLTYADINDSLRGRRAELFWPDDNLWYLIEIHDLDLSNNKAQIMYITGETEELNLTEIVREGHMSLISV